jgi:hypothetical protein
LLIMAHMYFVTKKMTSESVVGCFGRPFTPIRCTTYRIAVSIADTRQP